MLNTHPQTIEGQLLVGRNFTVGGEGLVQGGMTVNHDLRVKGRILSLDIQGGNKGLFSSVETLEKTFRKPVEGWYAYIEGEGEELPEICIVANGRWYPTGRRGMLDYTDLHDYKEWLTRIEEQFTEDIETLDAAIEKEIVDRTDADAELAAAIQVEAEARDAADVVLDGKIEAEQNARIAADNTEKSERQADVQALTNALANETRAREDAIEAEQSARIAADNGLATAISEEATAREDADTILSDAFDEFVQLTGLSQEESCEFLKLTLDSEGKFLFGIRTDGSVEWAKGIPKPVREEIDSTRVNLSQRILEIEDKTVLSLDIDPENGDVYLTYGTESPLTDAEIDPLTGDINFYYDL